MDITPYLAEFCRLFIFTVLLFSSLGKVRTFAQFRDDLTESLKVTKSIATVATSALVTIEGLLAILLLMNSGLTYYAMLAAVVLFAGFTAWISYSVIQSRLVRCNCFGQQDEYVSHLDIIRNGILLLASSFYLWAPKASPVPIAIQGLLLGMGLIAFLIVTNLKNITMVARKPRDV